MNSKFEVKKQGIKQQLGIQSGIHWVKKFKLIVWMIEIEVHSVNYKV